MDFEGLSGRIRFERGKRVDFKLDIIELTQNGLRTVISFFLVANKESRFVFCSSFDAVQDQTLEICSLISAYG